MRITGVTFSEGPMYEETVHTLGVYPAGDPVPLTPPPWGPPNGDPVKVIDPASAFAPSAPNRKHLYSDCFVGFGRWELERVQVTNNNPFQIYWTLTKFPPMTYKDIDNHALTYKYTGSAPGAVPTVDARRQAIFYSIPLGAFQSFVTPDGWKHNVQAGESLWGCCNPGGWPWTAFAPVFPPPGYPDVNAYSITNMTITGTIVL